MRNIEHTYEKQYQFLEEKEEYMIEAMIVSEPVEKEYKIVYEIEVKSINGDLKYKDKRWLLNIKKTKNSKISKRHELKFSNSCLQFGDLITFSGTIEIPSGARNYKGFDYLQYLKTQKLYGTITISDELEIISHNESKLLDRIWHNIRQSMKEKIYILLPEKVRELCVGMLIGDRKDISEEIVSDFSKSNLIHMLAISGAHVSYIILSLSFLLHKTKYQFRKILIIILLFFFIGLTGFTPSVERASLMAILTLIAGLVYRKQDIYTNLCFSCLVIVFSNPYAILNIGFQLSYGGTIGIVLFQKKFLR